MTDDATISAIDHLHALEGSSLLTRVAESAPYIPVQDVDEAAAIEQMQQEERQHLQWLADLIDQLDATPGPRRVDTSSADLHFSRLETLLPRAIASKQRLIQNYESVLEKVSSHSRAADVVGNILGRHRAHMTRLKQLLDSVTT